MRCIIRYFLKPASISRAFLRRYSGVKPSSISSSAGAAPSWPSAPGSPGAYFGAASAVYTPGNVMPAGAGPELIGNDLTAGIPAGGGILGPSGGGGGT